MTYTTFLHCLVRPLRLDGQFVMFWNGAAPAANETADQVDGLFKTTSVSFQSTSLTPCPALTSDTRR